jgi:S-adenosylmethionine:tRNA ribosyltransferase-isomerase
MRVDVFDFDLPEENIALRPAQPRDTAKLLHVGQSGQLSDHIIRELGDFFKPGDALIVNDTRVIPARLSGVRHRAGASGAQVEVTLIERLNQTAWRGLLKPAKRVKRDDVIHFENTSENARGNISGNTRGSVTARVLTREDAAVVLDFDIQPTEMEAVLATIGAMPLPPYIAAKRKPDRRDLEDYQTLFAARDGAVAAPTAGLHFTPDLRDRLAAKGVRIFSVTLHVGPGTFLPVKVNDTTDHVMHSEWGEVTADTAAALNEIRAAGGRITCVGTTSLRLIESAADDTGKLHGFKDGTDIFITPGYVFKATDRLLTNFHLPKSTLFMLVSAFSGLNEMQNAYAHAIAEGYRFYSYGDACLLDCQAGLETQ